MRCFDQGAYVRVTCDTCDVYAFAQRWPCSGLNLDKGVSFTFQRSNGDLVDTNAQENGHADGEALVALSTDAQNYAATRLKDENLRR